MPVRSTLVGTTKHYEIKSPQSQRAGRCGGRKVFEEFFEFKCGERKGRDTLAVLFDEAGLSLILSNFDRKTTPEYPRDFHLGFIQENEGQVEALYQRLHAAGHASQSPRGMHGSWGFYFAAPGGIQVEVSCPLEPKA